MPVGRHIIILIYYCFNWIETVLWKRPAQLLLHSEQFKAFYNVWYSRQKASEYWMNSQAECNILIYRFLYGIIDGWRVNKNYKNFLLKMKINDITNNDAEAITQVTVDLGTVDKQKTQIIQICERGIRNKKWTLMQIKMMTTYML